jgi:2-keto-4-pentenoate hydratase/2-oxohepta-3-ene-1,7-dioic acid hydratase in catechol pathway
MRWLRFLHDGAEHFGALADDDATVTVYTGDLFSAPTATDLRLPLAELTLLVPCQPTKFIGLWNNFVEAASKQSLAIPSEPLYFIKAPSSHLAHDQPIQRPSTYSGRVVFEGELGVVIGRRIHDAPESEAESAIFGYTCVDDVTALDLITADPAFPQWTRAKSFDTFGPFGPWIATDVDPSTLTVRTLLNGRERQNYSVSDMIFAPRQIVSAISRELTLEPGDLIACGTSLGAGVLRPGQTVEVSIEGVGVLRNQLG